MEIVTIKKFAQEQCNKLKKMYNFDDPKKMNLPFTVKIMEELGELCDEVLAHSGLQRKEKLEKLNKKNLSEEFADVILTTFILAQNMGIDIEEGLTRKMKKINGRY